MPILYAAQEGRVYPHFLAAFICFQPFAPRKSSIYGARPDSLCPSLLLFPAAHSPFAAAYVN